MCRCASLLLGTFLLAGLSGPALLAADRNTRRDVSDRIHLAAGDLVIGVSQVQGGLRLDSIYDVRGRHEFLTTNPLPFFSLTFRRRGDERELRLEADTGWGLTSIRTNHGGFELRWEQPRSEILTGLVITAKATADSTHHAWHWRLAITNPNHEWGIWRVVFPQVTVANLGEGGRILFPRGPGEVQQDAWQRPFGYHGSYPDNGCTMQFMAAYREGATPTGLYLAAHDPWGSTKDLILAGNPTNQTVRLGFDIPAPNMGIAGNSFSLSGDVVWQLFRGDWFDAAMIYKSWVVRESRWWPQLRDGQRRDTPRWMRELNVWAMTGGTPADCLPRVKQFQSFLNLPVGYHWYNWHQIPFDNDYPHYFPAKAGFSEGVAELQRAPVYVMPYINGRLWDTRDQGAEDWEFTRRALPAAAKRADGQPYTESYGSKETNGTPVKLAVMCPATTLWQQTVRDIVLRLLREAGTKAVYIDQIAAAAPQLCMDPAHGHPLGGGHWWNEGYWTMLEAIRRAMPRDAMLTTECNAEPFVRWCDGYLTWHWQHDGQVPAFPAVYGGAIQMFGRAYRGGATKDLALRMKAGQQLAFGEQLGWIDPGVINEPGNGDYFRQVAQLRAKVNRYFYAGEMARPPRLADPLVKVKADWQWSGEWWVTTDAVLTGAWRIPAEKRLVLLFANVSDEPVTTTLRFDPATYGLRPGKIRLEQIEAGQTRATPESLSCPFERPITFPARSAQALELRW